MALTKIKLAQMDANSVDSDQYVDGSIDTAHIKDDQVTVDKLANSINTEIAANTAKVTNATHTGDVTGDTALTIAANAVETGMIADANVTTAKIADDAVTSAKLDTNIAVTGTLSDSLGNVRSILQTSKSASYTPSDRSDVGKHIYTDSAVVINNSVTWVAGDAISIVNKHASNNVVITFTNITAYIAGDATAKGTITVAARGMGTILFTTATECFVGGAGLS